MTGRWPWIVVKTLGTVGLLGFIIREVGLDGVEEYLESTSFPILLLAGLLLIAQVFIGAKAWALCLSFSSRPVSYAHLARITGLALALNQVIPASAGGLLSRTVLLHKEGLKLGEVLTSIFLERFTNILAHGLAGLIGLIIVTHALEDKNIVSFTIYPGLLVLLPLLGIVIFKFRAIEQWLGSHLLPDKAKTLILEVTRFLASPQLFLAATAFGFCWFLVSFSALSLIAYAGSNVDLSLLFFGIVAVSLLLASIPISIAGWGLREGVMIILMPLAGLGKPEALAISVLYGTILALSRIPTAIFFLLPRFGGESSLRLRRFDTKR